MIAAALDTSVDLAVRPGALVGASADGGSGPAGTATGRGFLQSLDSVVADAAGLGSVPSVSGQPPPAVLPDKVQEQTVTGVSSAGSGPGVTTRSLVAPSSVRQATTVAGPARGAVPEPLPELPASGVAADGNAPTTKPDDTAGDATAVPVQGLVQLAAAIVPLTSAVPAVAPGGAGATRPVSKPTTGTAGHPARPSSPVRPGGAIQAVAPAPPEPGQQGITPLVVTPDRVDPMAASTDPTPALESAVRRAAATAAPSAAPITATIGKDAASAISDELSPALALPAAHLLQDQAAIAGAAAAPPARLPSLSALAATGIVAADGVAGPLGGVIGKSAIAPPPARAAPDHMPASTVAPVLLHLARTDGLQSLSVRLDPAELGAVEIRVERAATGPARVELLAAHAGTLDLLRADGAALNRALDAAGVPSEGRQISFSLGNGDAGSGGTAANPGGSAFGGSGHSAGQNSQNAYGRIFSPAEPAPTASGGWEQFGVDFLA